jgi:hypothetical protein
MRSGASRAMADKQRARERVSLRRTSKLAVRETALTILLSAARLWESRAIISQTKRLLTRATTA